jgi:hypothetical protein
MKDWRGHYYDVGSTVIYAQNIGSHSIGMVEATVLKIIPTSTRRWNYETRKYEDVPSAKVQLLPKAFSSADWHENPPRPVTITVIENITAV